MDGVDPVGTGERDAICGTRFAYKSTFDATLICLNNLKIRVFSR